jgi:Protein of Unknown function (DUF2784)
MAALASLVSALASLALLAHLAWIALVIFGALWTRGRPIWSAVHIAALVWGIAVEAGPWSCPLTLAEQYFEARAGITPYQGSFLVHTLDAIVYPNLPDWAITTAGVAVCVFNLAIYARRWSAWRRQRRSGTERQP